MTMLKAQGDVLLIPISETQKLGMRLTEVPKDNGRVVLAYGEVTGHAHAIHKNATLFRDTGTGNGVLTVDGDGAELVHEEHATINLEPGTYEIRQQRTWDAVQRARMVAD